MDLKYYDLEMDAFSIRPDLDFLFLSESHEEAVAHMVYGLEQKEDITLIVGDIGTGKTLAIQRLLKNLSGSIVPVEVNVTALDFESLVRLVLIKLGQEPDTYFELADLIHMFETTLAEFSRTNRKIVLVIDEAQNLVPDVLEGIRLLMNVGQGGPQVIQLVLVGQLGLLESLALPELRQLRQRIRVEYRFCYLNRDETGAYIRHRLKVAGREAPLFDDQAIAKIHDLSGGVPRLVNYLASKALLSGYVSRAKKISARHVDEAEFMEAHGASAAAAKENRQPVTEAAAPSSAPAETPAAPVATAPESKPASAEAAAPVAGGRKAVAGAETRRSRRGGVVIALLVLALVVAGVLTRGYWLPAVQGASGTPEQADSHQVATREPVAGQNRPAQPAAGTQAVVPSPADQEGPVGTTAEATEQELPRAEEPRTPDTEVARADSASPAQAPVQAAAQAPVQATPEPRPVAPAVREGTYSLHVASFREEARARNFHDHFLSLETGSFIKVIDSDEGQVWYRVYLGPFLTREEATAEAERLKEAEEISYFRVLKMTPDS